MLDSKRIRGLHLLPYLRNTDVQWDRINTTNLPRMDIAPSEYARYTVKLGDLLICEGGEVGRCAIWNDDIEICGFQKALHRLRPLSVDCDLPRYLQYVLRAATKAGAFNDGHESTIAHLTGDKLRVHRFPFPDKGEQIEIVAYLDDATCKIDRAVAGAQREVDLLREYRSRLISDVVTGKLDVRGAAAKLPDEGDIDDETEGAEELTEAEDVEAVPGEEVESDE
jgi:type I restriction enzyme S subunit